MKKMKKAIRVLILVLPAIVGCIGYILGGESFFDSLYMAIRMYLIDADTTNNNFLVEIARWVAPVCTISGLIIILRTFWGKVKDFFAGFSSDAVAVYGDTDMKKFVRKSMVHAINVEDNEILDVDRHIIMFSTDEKSLEFYRNNKAELKGKVYIKLDKNDCFSVSVDDVKFFNPCEIIARDFWQHNDIRQVLKKDDMKIAVVGSDVLARKILTYGLLNNIYSLTQRIEYHVWSNNPFFKNAHRDFQMMNGDSIYYHDNEDANRLFDIASADRIIITGVIDNELLSELIKMTSGEIYCFDPMGTFVNIFDRGTICTFGNYDEILTAENICTENLYDFAKKLNHEYALKYLEKGKTPPTVEEAWSELDAFTKGSNIASTDYHKIRLIVMKETGKSHADNVLAELEHIRWSRYHFLNHWRYGQTSNGKKDPDNRIHPCLVPFDELDDVNKQKDADGIEVLLSLEGIE